MSQASSPDEPRVSVVIAAYNAETYVAQAVRSVLAQTIDQVEVIVVDDGSVDGTAVVVGGLHDPRVRLIRVANGGPSAARNRGIAESRGEWVAILDADDYFSPDRLATMLKAAAEGIDVLADDLTLVDAVGNLTGTFFEEVGLELSEPVLLDPIDFIEGRLAGRPTPRPGILKPLYRRRFLIGLDCLYDETVRGPEDWLFYCRILLRGARFLLLPSSGYFYRRLPESLSLGDPVRFLENEDRAIRVLVADPMFPDLLQPRAVEWLREIRGRLAAERVLEALSGRRFGEAVQVARTEPAAIKLLLVRLFVRVRVRLALGRRLDELRGILR